MEIIQVRLDKQAVDIDQAAIACIGYFDGIHRGHQALIQRTIELARTENLCPALVTFDPDPWVIVKGMDRIKHLTPIQDRLELCARYGIERVYVLNFTRDFSLLEPLEFLHLIHDQYKINHMVCGPDFHFGRYGQGNPQQAQTEVASWLKITIVEEVDLCGAKISSSEIVNAIEAGQMATATKLLGHPYSMSGTVVSGRQQGRVIGYPTANLLYDNEYVIPKHGVYVGQVQIDGQRYMAMINVGHNPTFNSYELVSVESYILDFNANIYGKRITVEFLYWIRDEIRFDSIAALVAQMDQDQVFTREFFAHAS